MPDDDLTALLLEIGGCRDDVRDAERNTRSIRVLWQRSSERVAQAFTECTGAYVARFGAAVPSILLEKLESLGPKSLALATLLIGSSEDLSAFNDAFALLVGTFVEGKSAGARQILQRTLEGRFGCLDFVHELAIQGASPSELNRCFLRLDAARSALDVVAELLPSDDREAGPS